MEQRKPVGLVDQLKAASTPMKMGLAVGTIVLVLIIIGSASGTDKKENGDVAAAQPAAGAEGAQKPAEAPAAPQQSVPIPPPVQVPPPPIEEQFAKSYRDNRGFMGRASNDKLAIGWSPADGFLTIEVTPSSVLTEGDSLTITSATTLVANRAIWTTYPDVKTLQVVMLGEFTDQFGAKKIDKVALITVDRATGIKFQYDGMKNNVLGDNKSLFCVANAYRIHPSIYNALKDKGCLARWGPVKFG